MLLWLMLYSSYETCSCTALQHPSHGKVHMVMYYRDFGPVQIRKSSLHYKINTLLQMFTAHYDPADPQHMLSITFDSVKDLKQITEAVQKGIAALAAA